MFDDWRICKNSAFTRKIDGDLFIARGVVALVEGDIGGNLFIEDEAQVLLRGKVHHNVQIGRGVIFENKGQVNGEVFEIRQ